MEDRGEVRSQRASVGPSTRARTAAARCRARIPEGITGQQCRRLLSFDKLSQILNTLNPSVDFPSIPDYQSDTVKTHLGKIATLLKLENTMHPALVEANQSKLPLTESSKALVVFMLAQRRWLRHLKQNKVEEYKDFKQICHR